MNSKKNRKNMHSDVLFLLHLGKLAKSEATAIVVKDKTAQWPIMKIGLVTCLPY